MKAKRYLAGLIWCVSVSLVYGQAPIETLETTQNAQRVIALSPHSVELLFALGAGKRIIATIDHADYPEQAKSIPRIGGYSGVQIERMLELKPDLVIVWEGGNRLQDIEKMEALGLNVYRSQTNNLENIGQELRVLGGLLGLQTEGDKAADQFNARLTRIRNRYAHKTPVVFFYQLWDEPLRAMAAGSWINTVMASCGGVNIFSDESLDYPQVSVENILVAAPQAIIIPTHHDHGAGMAGAERWRRWPEIPAVKNNRIFFIDGNTLHRFTTRILDGMAEVCRAFDVVRSNVPAPDM